jgi:hypothetical protein
VSCQDLAAGLDLEPLLSDTEGLAGLPERGDLDRLHAVRLQELGDGPVDDHQGPLHGRQRPQVDRFQLRGPLELGDEQTVGRVESSHQTISYSVKSPRSYISAK